MVWSLVWGGIESWSLEVHPRTWLSSNLSGLRSSLTLTLLTDGGHGVSNPDVNPIQSMISSLGIAFAHETTQLRIRSLDLPRCIEASQMADIERCLIQWPHSSELVLRWVKSGAGKVEASLFTPSLEETTWEGAFHSKDDSKLGKTLQSILNKPMDSQVMQRCERWFVPFLIRSLDYEGRVILLQGLVDRVDVERMDALSTKMRCQGVLVIQGGAMAHSSFNSKVSTVSPTDTDFLQKVEAFAKAGSAVTLVGLAAKQDKRDIFAEVSKVVLAIPMSTIMWKADIESLKPEGILDKSVKLMCQEEAWLRSFEEQQADSSFQVRAGTYVVAGGTRGLGLQMAKWLLEHGASTVVALGRSKPESYHSHPKSLSVEFFLDSSSSAKLFWGHRNWLGTSYGRHERLFASLPPPCSIGARNATSLSIARWKELCKRQDLPSVAARSRLFVTFVLWDRFRCRLLASLPWPPSFMTSPWFPSRARTTCCAASRWRCCALFTYTRRQSYAFKEVWHVYNCALLRR